MSRLEKWTILILFCLVLAVPGVMFAAGIGPKPLPNEQLDPPPDMDAARLMDPALYAEVSDWYSDRLPIRPPAVTADAWIDRHVFSDNPNPSVMLGNDGWLFFAATILNPCLRTADADAIRNTLNDADGVLHYLDHDLVVVIGPDKASIYPEKLSDRSVRLCNRHESVLLQEAIESGVPSAIDTWTWLRSNRQTLPQAVYEPSETHWTSAGAVLITEALINAIDPSLWNAGYVTVDESVKPPIGDLSLLIGLPEPALPQSYRIRRPAVTVDNARSEGGLDSRTTTATGAPMVENSTLFVHDSFGARLTGTVAPFFASMTWNTWHSFEASESPAMELAKAMLEKDRVMLEIAERETYRQVPNLVREAILRVVEMELDQLPSKPLDPALIFDTTVGEPVSLNPSEPTTVSVPDGAGLRFLVLDVTETETPSLRIDGDRYHSPANGRIALRIGPGTTFTIEVRDGQVAITSARIIEIP